MPTRRSFLDISLKFGLTWPFLMTGLNSCGSPSVEASDTDEAEDKKLSILILGGTSFLGPHQIAYAMERGHRITTFTRGKTKPSVHAELFDQVESLVGDREDNLSALEGRSWDVVIDNSGRKTEWTKKTAELLKDSCELYVYVSSTGVYFPYLGDDITEDTEVLLELPA
ncbi:MAG: hypothetical protein AAF840_03215, partial [Bacteroidota bacterium]